MVLRSPVAHLLDSTQEAHVEHLPCVSPEPDALDRYRMNCHGLDSNRLINNVEKTRMKGA